MAKVIQYYHNYDEDIRLFRDNSRLMEYLTTIHYFDRLLKPGSQILDVCAGTGRYAFYLAGKGHYVTACDLVEHHVEIMKSKPNADKLMDISVCNALDLSRFEDNSFDVVLCMGALYHLGSNDNEKAISESIRVCRPSGIIVFTYLHAKIIDKLEGIFFGITPYEMEALAKKHGLEQKHNAYTGGAFDETLSEASDEEFQKFMEHHLSTCEEKSAIEDGGLGLWIGIKPPIKENQMKIRKTTPNDLEAVMEIYTYARTYMAENGNPNQWQTTHPPKEVIQADINAGLSYVCTSNIGCTSNMGCVCENEILAVFYFNIEEEPTYSKIDGQWLSDAPYGVVHRIARGPKGKGAGAYALNWCTSQHPNIRIDTHKDNAPMLKLLENLGYTYCGVIWLENGDERLAYQRVEGGIG